MECRANCGACCIAPSINKAIPGMPNGKPAGVRCLHLDEQQSCKIFNAAERPTICGQFKAEPSVCGSSAEEALDLLRILEAATAN